MIFSSKDKKYLRRAGCIISFEEGNKALFFYKFALHLPLGMHFVGDLPALL
jgi:hypothetical protein